MDIANELPESLRNQIKNIGTVVTTEDLFNPQQLESYERVTKAKDQSFKLQTLVTAWQKQNRAERRLRRKVAWCILVALALQVVVINTCFFLIGFKVMTVSVSLSKLFLISVFVEIVAMVLIVLRYLFPQTGSEFIQLIKEL